MVEVQKNPVTFPCDFSTTIKKFIIVGNPNVGKSVIFGRLANKYVTVSNYPGTTVTLSKGWMQLPSGPIPLIDSPGVNNLLPNSEEEVVTRNILLDSDRCDRVIQVLDTKNLQRGLFLTIQLSEMASCGMLALNMWDEFQLRGYVLDVKKLEEIFSVPCVPTVAIHNKGVMDLKKQDCRHFRYRVQYHPAIETAITSVISLLPVTGITPRALALMALSGDQTFWDFMKGKISEEMKDRIHDICESTERMINTDLRSAINKTRMAEAERIAAAVLRQREALGRRMVCGGLSILSTHPWLGFGLLGVVLYAMYQFVGVLGAGTLVDIVENKFFNHVLNPAMIRFVDTALPFSHDHMVEDGVILPAYARAVQDLTVPQNIFRFMHDFLVGEYGAVTMALTYGFAIIFPVVVTFFLAFGLLEDLGYLPRLSVLLNGFFKTIGLNGKAVLPMVLGLGCDTMATVTARILDTPKERIIVTFLLALAIPCSAQLAVIMFLLQGGAGAAGVLIWAAVVTVVLFVAGYLASLVVPGDENPLVLEIPPLRVPAFRNIVLKTLARVEWYLKEVIPIFLIGTAILFLLNELHLLKVLQWMLKPMVVDWLGLPPEGAEAILMGFFRRDYGAAGFIKMFEQGALSKAQIVIGVTTITLFVPCIANALVMIKERGQKMATEMFFIVFVTAFGIGGLLRYLLQWVSL